MSGLGKPKRLNVGYAISTCACVLAIAAYYIGANDATREVKARINAEHQQAIEDAVVCKLSLALTQGRLQRFEQVESEQLQSCCASD